MQVIEVLRAAGVWRSKLLSGHLWCKIRHSVTLCLSWPHKKSASLYNNFDVVATSVIPGWMKITMESNSFYHDCSGVMVCRRQVADRQGSFQTQARSLLRKHQKWADQFESLLHLISKVTFENGNPFMCGQWFSEWRPNFHSKNQIVSFIWTYRAAIIKADHWMSSVGPAAKALKLSFTFQLGRIGSFLV